MILFLVSYLPRRLRRAADEKNKEGRGFGISNPLPLYFLFEFFRSADADNDEVSACSAL